MEKELIKVTKLRTKRLKNTSTDSKSITRKAELSVMLMGMSTEQIVNYIYDMEVRVGYHI